MRPSDKLYNFPRQISRVLESISRDLSQENSGILKSYYRQRVAEGISNARIMKCLTILKLISKSFSKPFTELTKNDIVEFVAGLEQRNFSEWTKHDYKTVLKKFFQWLRNCENDEYPPEVRWIRVGRNFDNGIQSKDLLTDSEISRLAQAAYNQRDRAF